MLSHASGGNLRERFPDLQRSSWGTRLSFDLLKHPCPPWCSHASGQTRVSLAFVKACAVTRRRVWLAVVGWASGSGSDLHRHFKPQVGEVSARVHTFCERSRLSFFSLFFFSVFAALGLAARSELLPQSGAGACAWSVSPMLYGWHGLHQIALLAKVASEFATASSMRPWRFTLGVSCY